MSDIKIFNQDCLEYMKTIKDKSVDLIVTDPPYDLHVGIVGGSCASHMGRTDRFKNENVACKHLNRNFIGTEISEEYFKIAQDRLNEDKQHIEGFFE